MSDGKKGFPIWAWFGIGCAAVAAMILAAVVVGGLFVAKKVKDVAGDFADNPEMTIAREIVKHDPDLEEVSEDPDEGTITVKEKKSGKSITVNLHDLREGKLSFDTEEGHVQVSVEEDDGDSPARVKITSEEEEMVIGGAKDAYPSWIPVPGDMEAEQQYMNEGGGLVRGALTLKGTRDAEGLASFYEKELAGAGFKLNKSVISGEQSMIILVAEQKEKGMTVNLTITPMEKDVSAILSYTEKKSE